MPSGRAVEEVKQAPAPKEPASGGRATGGSPPLGLIGLQRLVGNAVVCRLLDGQASVSDDPVVSRSLLPVIQRDLIGDPADSRISAAMTAAGYASLGPYLWDTDKDQFVLDDAYAYDFASCLESTAYDPEKVPASGAAKLGKVPPHALKAGRLRKARTRYFGQAQGPLTALLQHDEGKTPRPFVSLTAEGALGGHAHERHVVGMGHIVDRRALGLRAAFHRTTPDGPLLKLDDTGVASAFTDETAANDAVAAVVSSALTANWVTHRMTIAKGATVKLTAVLDPSKADGLQKSDAPPGDKLEKAVDWPKYITSALPGRRELFTGDYTGDPAHVDAPEPGLAKLTHAVVLGNIDVFLTASQAAPGGWYVETAYPKL